jgi:heme/copper-type cytochrome/quinol oxidase subunit 2
MPPGWYDDPFTDHLQRYWTGTTWTKETRPLISADPAPVGAATPTSTAPDASVAVRDYLVWSIVALIFCFWPLAIPAVYFAVRANSTKRAGDTAAAVRYAERARLFLMLSVVGGVLVGAYLIWTVISDGPGSLGV